MCELSEGELDNDKFGVAFTLLPGHAHDQGRQLIALLLLTHLASWDWRFEQELDEMPLWMLHVLEFPNNEEAPIRKLISETLL